MDALPKERNLFTQLFPALLVSLFVSSCSIVVESESAPNSVNQPIQSQVTLNDAGLEQVRRCPFSIDEKTGNFITQARCLPEDVWTRLSNSLNKPEGENFPISVSRRGVVTAILPTPSIQPQAPERIPTDPQIQPIQPRVDTPTNSIPTATIQITREELNAVVKEHCPYAHTPITDNKIITIAHCLGTTLWRNISMRQTGIPDADFPIEIDLNTLIVRYKKLSCQHNGTAVMRENLHKAGEVNDRSRFFVEIQRGDSTHGHSGTHIYDTNGKLIAVLKGTSERKKDENGNDVYENGKPVFEPYPTIITVICAVNKGMWKRHGQNNYMLGLFSIPLDSGFYPKYSSAYNNDGETEVPGFENLVKLQTIPYFVDRFYDKPRQTFNSLTLVFLEI